MAPRSSTSRVNESYVVIWATALLLCFVAAFALLIWDVATVGVRSSHPLLAIGASSLLLVIALVSHCALGYVRGIASGLWPGLIFPAAFCAFHFASLGVLVAGWYNERLFPFAWNLSVVCLIAWLVGYALTRGSLGFVDRPVARWGRRELGVRELQRIATFGALVLILGFAMQLAVHFALGVPSFGAVEYLRFKAAMSANGGLAAVHLFGQMCCVVGVTVTVCASALGHRRLFYARWVAALAGVYVLSLFFQGDRSEMSVVLFPMFLARHYFIEAFSLRRVALIGVLAVMVFAGTKIYRGTGNFSDFVASATDTDKVVGRTSDETGTTLDTVIRSVELVPEHFDHFHGATYGYALLRVVPNIVTGRKDAGFVSSIWVTRQTTKTRVAGKGGLGFSIVAEAYINFGAIGAPFVLLLIGLFHGYAERWLAGRAVDIRLVTLFIVLEVALLIHVRNSAVLYIRGSIWMATLLVLVFGLHRFIRGAGRKSV